MVTERTSDDNGPMQRGSRPVPDPTILTTQQLYREISSLKELIEMRMAAYDKAIVLLQNKADRSPSIDEVVARFEEKLKGIDIQFRERDIRVEQATKESKVAVDAAFSAQKEAVSEQNKSAAAAIAKSEANTTKQIDSILTLLAATTKSVDEKIDDLKGRLNLIEGKAKGSNDVWAYIIAVGGVVIAALALLFKGGA